MKSMLRRKGARWLIAGAAVALLAGWAALSVLRPPAAAGESVDQARARWEAGAPDAYTLSVRQQTRVGVCEQEIVAEGERAVQAAYNSCGQPANWTVTRLLNWIVELERVPSRCYPSPSSCACQISANTIVTYDSAIGYPRQIIYEWYSRPNLMNPDYWRLLTDKTFPGCSNIQGNGPGGTMVVNVGLTPAP